MQFCLVRFRALEVVGSPWKDAPGHRQRAQRARRQDLLQRQHKSHLNATRRTADAVAYGDAAPVRDVEALAQLLRPNLTA